MPLTIQLPVTVNNLPLTLTHDNLLEYIKKIEPFLKSDQKKGYRASTWLTLPIQSVRNTASTLYNRPEAGLDQYMEKIIKDSNRGALCFDEEITKKYTADIAPLRVDGSVVPDKAARDFLNYVIDHLKTAYLIKSEKQCWDIIIAVTQTGTGGLFQKIADIINVAAFLDTSILAEEEPSAGNMISFNDNSHIISATREKDYFSITFIQNLHPDFKDSVIDLGNISITISFNLSDENTAEDYITLLNNTLTLTEEKRIAHLKKVNVLGRFQDKNNPDLITLPNLSELPLLSVDLSGLNHQTEQLVLTQEQEKALQLPFNQATKNAIDARESAISRANQSLADISDLSTHLSLPEDTADIVTQLNAPLYAYVKKYDTDAYTNMTMENIRHVLQEEYGLDNEQDQNAIINIFTQNGTEGTHNCLGLFFEQYSGALNYLLILRDGQPIGQSNNGKITAQRQMNDQGENEVIFTFKRPLLSENKEQIALVEMSARFIPGNGEKTPVVCDLKNTILITDPDLADSVKTCIGQDPSIRYDSTNNTFLFEPYSSLSLDNALLQNATNNIREIITSAENYITALTQIQHSHYLETVITDYRQIENTYKEKLQSGTPLTQSDCKMFESGHKVFMSATNDGALRLTRKIQVIDALEQELNQYLLSKNGEQTYKNSNQKISAERLERVSYLQTVITAYRTMAADYELKSMNGKLAGPDYKAFASEHKAFMSVLVEIKNQHQKDTHFWHTSKFLNNGNEGDRLGRLLDQCLTGIKEDKRAKFSEQTSISFAKELSQKNIPVLSTTDNHYKIALTKRLDIKAILVNGFDTKLTHCDDEKQVIACWKEIAHSLREAKIAGKLSDSTAAKLSKDYYKKITLKLIDLPEDRISSNSMKKFHTALRGNDLVTINKRLSASQLSAEEISDVLRKLQPASVQPAVISSATEQSTSPVLKSQVGPTATKTKPDDSTSTTPRASSPPVGGSALFSSASQKRTGTTASPSTPSHT